MEPILDFLSGNNETFIIPAFQRNYSWDESQCRILFKDICNLCREHKKLNEKLHSSDDEDIKDLYKSKIENSIHYLGTVIWYGGKNSGSYRERILIDGQQRLTSILLLLCAIRYNTNDKNTKEIIMEKYLKNKNKNGEYSVRLKQTKYDDECFLYIVENGKEKTLKEEEKSNNVIDRYNTFIDLLNGVKNEFSPEDILEILNYVQIVDINLSSMNINQIQMVFEKINSTGKPLSDADLIRNYLLIVKNMEEQTRLYENYWLKIEKRVKTENILEFIKIYLVICTYKADDISDKKLYSTFKEYFDRTKKSREEIMKDMLYYSKYYAWLLQFDDNHKCPNEKIDRKIEYIKKLKARSFYSVCVYCLSKYSPDNKKEMERIFELFTDFLIRYRVVSPSGGGGALNTIVSELLKGFEAEESSEAYIPIKYDDIRRKLSNSKTRTGRFPDNAEFKEKLKQSVNYDVRTTILFLRIEESKTHNVVGGSVDKYSLEHLMPQSVINGKKSNAKKWREYLGGEENAKRLCDKYLHCIGNLAIISMAGNSGLSNSDWSVKLEGLRDCQFASTTSKIPDNYPEWNEDAIKRRNEEIAELACKYITAPLEREIPYQAYENAKPLSSLENLDSNEIDQLVSFIYNDEEMLLTPYYKSGCVHIFEAICQIVYNAVPDKFNTQVTESLNVKKKDISSISEEDTKSMLEFSYLYEITISRLMLKNVFKYAKQIIEACDLKVDDFKVIYSDSDE